MSKPLSQNAIGRALGLSSASMVKLKKQGCPMHSVESARAWREAHQNAAQSKPAPAGAPIPVVGAKKSDFDRVGGDDFRAMVAQHEAESAGVGVELDEDLKTARTRREIAEANLAEMREAEERGDLIRVSAVKATLATVFATTRDAMLQIPSRLAPLLAADADPASVQNTLHAEIHQALHTLANAPIKIGQAEGVLA